MDLFCRIVFLLVVPLFLLCRTPGVTSLSTSPSSSSSSPLKGYYHFGTSSAMKTANPNSKKVTASDALRQGRRQNQQYVPDGLTLEQYTTIKNDELAKTRSMNFGAWGPRFQLVDGDPDSNWFNIPSLWTAGYNANNVRNCKQMQKEKPVDWPLRKRIVGMAHVLDTYLPRYALAYMILLLSTHFLLNKSTLLSTKYIMSSMKVPKYWLTVMIVSRALLIPLAILKLLNLISCTLIGKEISQ